MTFMLLALYSKPDTRDQSFRVNGNEGSEHDTHMDMELGDFHFGKSVNRSKLVT